MKKFWFIITSLVLFGVIGVSFVCAETVTVTTYHPAPYGVYKELRLNPISGTSPGNHASGDSCDADEEGTIYYDGDEQLVFYCDGNTLTWEAVGGADPYWKFQDNVGSSPDYLFTRNQNWFVGIEREDPAMKLSQGVVASYGGDLCSRGEILSRGVIDSGADLVASGAGTRLIWWPKRAAFRAGGVSGDQWDAKPGTDNIGLYSIAMGYNPIATGAMSTAMGSDITASGNDSVAIGDNLITAGTASIALGSNITVNSDGHYSIAIGHNLVITNDNAILIGSGVDDSNRLGNGIKDSLMIGFGGTTPVFFVGPAGGSGSYGVVGIRTSDAGEIGARALYVKGPAGGTEAWMPPSDRTLKKNIQPIEGALDKVKRLRGVNFQWKDPKFSSEGTKLGIVAQEAKDVIPEVVSNSGKYYSIQYGPIVALLIEAVKEQQEKIDDLKARLNEAR